jgi:sporulation protein YlmC with PRC-barrel domain
MKSSEFIGMKVLDKEANEVGNIAVIGQKGMEIGKIDDMYIDPKGCLIHNVVISTGRTFNKKHLMISDEDIQDIGDYVILDLTKDQVEERIED